MMSRKNYEKVAEIISHVKDDGTREYLTREFVRMFVQDNPRFSTTRFQDRVDELAQVHSVFSEE